MTEKTSSPPKRDVYATLLVTGYRNLAALLAANYTPRFTRRGLDPRRAAVETDEQPGDRE